MVRHSPFTSHPPLTHKTQILCSDIDHQIATQLCIPLHKLNNPPKISAIDGGPIVEGVIHFCTKIITLHTSCLHLESMSFLITNTPHNLIIQGIPWLQQYDPIISWTR